MDTIIEAKRYLEDNFEVGAPCPCCNQLVKRYKRNLNSSMALALIEIYKANKKNGFNFFHVEDYFKDLHHLPSSIRGDFPKLRHWGLLEQKEGCRDDNSPRNGYYLISGKGVRFIRNELTVPAHIFVYNNEIKGVADTVVNIKECLGKKFNYDELMRGI